MPAQPSQTSISDTASVASASEFLSNTGHSTHSSPRDKKPDVFGYSARMNAWCSRAARSEKLLCIKDGDSEAKLDASFCDRFNEFWFMLRSQVVCVENCCEGLQTRVSQQEACNRDVKDMVDELRVEIFGKDGLDIKLGRMRQQLENDLQEKLCTQNSQLDANLAQQEEDSDKSKERSVRDCDLEAKLLQCRKDLDLLQDKAWQDRALISEWSSGLDARLLEWQRNMENDLQLHFESDLRERLRQEVESMLDERLLNSKEKFQYQGDPQQQVLEWSSQLDARVLVWTKEFEGDLQQLHSRIQFESDLQQRLTKEVLRLTKIVGLPEGDEVQVLQSRRATLVKKTLEQLQDKLQSPDKDNRTDKLRSPAPRSPGPPQAVPGSATPVSGRASLPKQSPLWPSKAPSATCTALASPPRKLTANTSRMAGREAVQQPGLPSSLPVNQRIGPPPAPLSSRGRE